MQVQYPQTAPIRYLIAGILIGIAMANLGVIGSALILAALAIAAHCRGFRVTLTKNDPPDGRR